MKRLGALAAVAISIAAILFAIDFYRHRYVRHNTEIVRLLPPGDFNLIFADLDALRRAQLLGLLANIKVAPDKEYADFLAQTGFDYTRDLDAVAVAMDGRQTFLIGRGRFHWDKLKQFAISRGGTCEAGACKVAGSTPGRWVNFITIQSDVLAVAITANTTAADELRPPGRRVQEEIPDAALWVKLSHSLLMNPSDLPLAAQLFAISLQSADTVRLEGRLDSVQLKANFSNPAAADTARRQLEIATKRLTTALAQDNQKPDRATVAGLLTAGSFQVVGNDVKGFWPLYPELLKALQ